MLWSDVSHSCRLIPAPRRWNTSLTIWESCISSVISYVLDDHDQERQLNTKGLICVSWACDVVGGDIGSHDFKDWALNIGIRYSLNMTVPNALVPYLQRFRPIFGVRYLLPLNGMIWMKIDQLFVEFDLYDEVLTRWSKGWKGSLTRKCFWTSLRLFLNC
jgi:hypothetical protein